MGRIFARTCTFRTMFLGMAAKGTTSASWRTTNASPKGVWAKTEFPKTSSTFAQPDATTAAELKMWRVLNQTECESFSRDVTLTGVADAQTTIYPCIWQGAVNGVNNSNCHPDYNPPTAACHCVSGSEPCIDQAPWLCSGTPTICEQEALDIGL